MNGSVMFSNSECQFNFDGKILTVYANNGEAKDILYDTIGKGATFLNKKTIPFERIEGYCYDTRRSIVFYIHKDKEYYGYQLSPFDEKKIILKISVKYYILNLKDIETRDKTTIKLYSSQFGNFFNCAPYYDYENDQNGQLATIKYNSNINNEIGNFMFKENTWTIQPNVNFKCGFDLFEFVPNLYLESQGDYTEEEIIELIRNWLSIISFLFMRKNIIPEKIEYFVNNAQYELVIVKQSDYVEEKNYKNNISKPACIVWNSIYENISTLFNDFNENLIYLDSLDKELKEREYISFEKISKEGAFFEYTFRLIYGDKVEHSSATQRHNDEIIAVLEKEKESSNRKKKKTIDFLIKQLDHVTLSKKIQSVLKNNKNCLVLIRERFKLSNETNVKIADTCANIRNWVDHGDEKANLDSYVANCFVILRATTYSMYLNRWGIEDSVISTQLINLFSL